MEHNDLSSQSSFDMLSPSKLKLVHFSNEFPPDDLQDLFRRLHVLSKDKTHYILNKFLQDSSTALRNEIRTLPDVLKALFPPFENVTSLAECSELRQGPLAGAMEGILLCVVEIGLFIAHHEKFPSQYCFSRKSSCFVGMGMGLLCAAAVAVSPSLNDLASAGAEAIRIALRMGVFVDEMSQNIEPRKPNKGSDSWAYVVIGFDEEAVQAELDTFNKTTHASNSNKIFISAASQNSVTVSGPPSRLRSMFQASEKLRYSKFIMLPVYGGLCHAPHIYERCHAAAIVSGLDPVVGDRGDESMIPLLCTSDGKGFEANTAKELFESVVAELMLGTIRWSAVVDGLIHFVKSSSATEGDLCVYRTSHVVGEMVNRLKSEIGSFVPRTIDLLAWLPKKADFHNVGDSRQSKIAIVGMSCRYPGGANDPELFWDLLQEGRDVHTKVPADRFDVDSHTDPTGKKPNTSLTPFGCFIDQPGLFDAGFFNMSPREALETDPMHRLALVTAYEALEQSGSVLNRTSATKSQRVSTFYGQASDDYREVNSGQNVDTYFIPGGCRAFAPGRINYFFKFSGPSFSCDTACSSSLATIQIACTSLWSGDTDMVVAGGLNVLTNSDAFAGLSRGHFLSKTGSCKTWDCNADGYCRADGVGSVILKRLEDAEADNDNILGMIISTATNHSAEAISITHPHAGHQADLYRLVANRAGINPLDIGYAEMHGTGTQAGDSIEIESITNVLAPNVPRKPKRAISQPLHIGAVKSNVGHGESAAGTTALIKVLLMLQKQAIPRHVGIKTKLTDRFPTDLDARNVKIPYEQIAWSRSPERKRYALINNFSAAGGNTTLLLEEAPDRAEPGEDPRTSFAVCVSGKGKASYSRNIQNLLSHIENTPDIRLADLAYTTAARRMHHTHRACIVGSSLTEVKKSLKAHTITAENQKSVPMDAPTVAFVFSGQGTFYSGVGKQFFQSLPYFREQILQLNDLARKLEFPSFLPAINGDGPENQVHAPIVTQLTIVCVGIALTKLWSRLGIKPEVVIGASLGEYAAFYAAGVLSASDAIYLAGERAKCLQRACEIGTHAMLAVRATPEKIKEDSAGKPYELACLNGRADVCVSGSLQQIADLRSSLEPKGHKCHQLDVPYAFHSAQMEPILSEFEEIAGGVTYNEPSVPIISPLLGEVVFDGKTINAEYMRRATRETVGFSDALEKAQAMGIVDDNTAWIDIGPHPICCNFIRSVFPEVTIATASLNRNESNWQTMTSSMSTLHLAGIKIDWNDWHRPFETNLRLLNLPNYAWNSKNYWIQYNGDWALTKDKAPAMAQMTSSEKQQASTIQSTLRTSLVHQVLEEVLGEDDGRLVVRSDLMQPEFLEAANGHRMNNCGVVTSSIHADVAYTLASHLYTRLRPGSQKPGMNMVNLEVAKGLIARKDQSKSQWIEIIAEADLYEKCVDLSWFNVQDDGGLEQFATAKVEFGSNAAWLSEWSAHSHLVKSRIDVLDQMANRGEANRLSRNMAYTLFGNLVDYAEKYRGMQSVVLNGMEAFANVSLTTQKGGTWTIPPYFIDSVAHLAGFICNGGDALDVKNNFFVTPGWQSMRFAKPLVPGGKYQSYVKMVPAAEEGIYIGDVYVLEKDEVIGLVGGIKFRKFPRLLMNNFFSPPDVQAKKTAVGTHSHAPAAAAATAEVKARQATNKEHRVATTKQQNIQQADMPPSPPKTPVQDVEIAVKVIDEPEIEVEAAKQVAEPQVSTVADLDTEPEKVKQALELIAAETAIDTSELTDDAQFANIGVDSLLSLVLSEKFKEELKVEVQSSLFLECPTVRDFKQWIADYC